MQVLAHKWHYFTCSIKRCDQNISYYHDYCSRLWNCSRYMKFLNPAATVITGKSYYVPSVHVDLLASLHWPSLESRRINSKLLLRYTYSNGHAAPNLGNEFNFNYEMECPYNFRTQWH